MFTKPQLILILATSSILASVVKKHNIECSEFTCNDGTCVFIQNVCDGIPDCSDGSDERDCQETDTTKHDSVSDRRWHMERHSYSSLPLKVKRQSNEIVGTSEMCTLPEPPANGRYVVHGMPGALPGQNFPALFLNISCEPLYEIKGNGLIYCYNGFWSAEMPECKRFCKLKPHPSVIYNCVVSGTNGLFGIRPCNESEPSGTRVKPDCQRPNYYSTGVLSYMQCTDGRWDYVATCTPECGTVTPTGQTLIIDGDNAERGELPWQTGIYSKTTKPYMQICGGSLISATAVISAAHCFWDDSNSKLHPASNYAVAVGKLYRPWNDPNDVGVQKSDVSSIEIPVRFYGSVTNYQDNIAILVVVTPFELKPHVRPVCLDFDLHFNTKQLQTGNLGKIGGWGLTSENGKPSQILQVVEIPYRNVKTCFEEFADPFKEFITSDKICAGLTKGPAFCRGDSGGGLTFPETERGILRYYLRGILSISPSSDNKCNSNTLSAFTEVYQHRNFISDTLVSKKWQCRDKSWISHNKRCDGEEDCPDGSDEAYSICRTSKPMNKVKCILPDYPLHGLYTVANSQYAVPGETSDHVKLTVTCDPGYGVNGTDTLFCYSGVWSQDMPLCIRYCKLKPHPSVEYFCIEDGIQTKSMGTKQCREFEPTGTRVRAECRRPNYYSVGILPYMNCIEGKWDYIATCSPECGTVAPNAIPLVAGGTEAMMGELPWHAAVYSKITKPYMLLCGATLISNTAVVSAAHCFWSDIKGKLPASNYAVAMGKIFRAWNAPLDTDAEKRDVQGIVLPERFMGSQTNYQGDIAVITVDRPFEYKTNIRPVCLDFDYNFNKRQLQPGNIGKVAGWGLTSANGQMSKKLKVANIPYIEFNECLRQVPNSFRRYITSDKICAGYLNGTALCRGDSGGGLVFPETDAGTVRYYLRGILSTAPTSQALCNVHTLSAFTEVINHENMILDTIEASVREWQCQDGTMIRLDARCDGVNDCPDGSDETEELCNKSKTPQYGPCILPEYPAHGRYVVQGNPDASPGLSLQQVALTVTCSPVYRINGPDSVSCLNGVWSSEMPQCVPFCRLKPDPSVEYQCFDEASNGTEVLRPCDEAVPSGAVVKATCRAAYYYAGIHPLMHCVDGIWDYVAACVPVCGKIISNNSIPWQAGIYRKDTKNAESATTFLQICGGSLISATTIISAAHCFFGKGNLLSESAFAVAVGKEYRQWNHSLDTSAQTRDVKNIIIPAKFRGPQSNFQDDIALVIVDKPFVYTLRVQPVCLDFDPNLNRRQLKSGNIGLFGGWGGTHFTDPKPFETLKIIQLSYISIEQCIVNTPVQFREYITSDKFCAEFTNGTSVCNGDGGGGLAFPISERGSQRYYLRGIFSTAPSSELACSADSITTFTEVNNHEYFIRDNIASNRYNNGNGDTVDESNKCESDPLCRNRTKETASPPPIVCYDEQFACKNGACISASSKCNNVIDCADGSDESKELCHHISGDFKPRPVTEATAETPQTTTQSTTTTTTTEISELPLDTTVTNDSSEATSSAKCKLPPQPENGVYKVVAGNVIDAESRFLLLHYSCYPRFAMLEDFQVFCSEGSWSTEQLPKCLQTCHLERHESMDYNCVVKDTEYTRSCNEYEVEGTVIQPACKEPNYYTPLELPYMRCSGGQWSSRPACVPECGTLTPKGSVLVLGGDTAKFGDVPWHAGIYYKDKGTHRQICGGSLISNTVVLSAAHCFWDEIKKKLNNVTSYAMAVGKLYRDWDSPDDAPFAQKADVKKIVITKYYKGRDLNFRDDIAVVIATAPFTYQIYVRPVCLDFRHDFNEIQLQYGNVGKVAGWGLTTGLQGSESKVLKVIDMPFVTYDKCVEQTSPAFMQYITYDKICAGDVNGLLLCRGDSGGGLAFPASTHNSERYYLRGIASTSPPTTDMTLCNTHALTGFTAISNYQNLIKSYWLQ